MADEPLPPFAVARLGTTRWRAPGKVECARFAPDGKKIVTAINLDVLRGTRDLVLYDSATGAAITELNGHGGNAYHAEFSADGRKVVSCGFDGSIMVWDLNANEPTRLFYQKDAGIDSVLLSRSGEMLVSAHWHPFVARVWEWKGRKEIVRSAAHEYSIRCLALSRDAAMFATSCSVEATVWDARSGAVVRRFEAHDLLTPFDYHKGVIALDFTADGKGLVVVKDQTIRTYDIGNGDLQDDLRLTPQRNAKTFASSNDWSCWAVGDWDGMIEIWDVVNRRRLRELAGHIDSVNSLDFSRDGKMLVSGGEDHTIRVWNVSTGESTFIARGHQHVVNRVAFASDDVLLSAGNDGKCRIWDVKNGLEIRSTPRGGEIKTLAVSANGKVAFAGGMEGRVTGPSRVRLWELSTGEQIGETTPHQSRIYEIIVAPATNHLITADSDATLRVWDLDTMRLIKRIGGFGGITSLAVSADAKIAAVGCRHGGIALWDLKSFRPARDFLDHGDEVEGGPNSLAFSADGQWLASAGDDAVIKFWRTSDYAKMAEVKAHDDWIKAIAFSPDSRLLASAADDYTVRLWRVDDQEELCVLRGHDNVVTSLAFSPNGKLLASGSYDTTILIWDVAAAIAQTK